MRTLVASNIVSLDGFIAGPGGNVMALPMDHSFDEHNAEILRAADTLLVGATTYRGFVGFWPQALDLPDLTGPSREIAERYAAGLEIVVVSDTLTVDECGPWRDQTRIVARADARRTVSELKQGPGRDVVTYGSATLVGDLLDAGLVDELHVLTSPVLLGDGVPAYPADVHVDLERRDVRTWEGSANVLTTYAVRSPG